ncbi:hypothetical protein C7S18_21555 [Ahniella affigens]|uniref:PEP-CTERM sorting domain-containing protein n=1 Tax=Ahniella affigens TaxID=2021234 RepID=A0A2P1PXM6_9GAMM|nr:hypothetical protein [Ahniella affigens]AVP99601.1 hypothetical protein C7S18_21555 [Ahniella affigens]
MSLTSARVLKLLLQSIGVCALAGATANAAVQCPQTLPLNVPATGEGLYLNLVTNVSGTTEASVPGFDINPYAAQNSDPVGQLKFYWGSAATNGAGVVTSGDSYAVLPPGQLIGPASTFSRAAFTGDTSAWQAGASGFLGVRFQQEPENAIRYGWIFLSSSPPLGFPLNIQAWCYEDSGAAITTPLPGETPLFVDSFES